jgi:hypothetical protein
MQPESMARTIRNYPRRYMLGVSTRKPDRMAAGEVRQRWAHLSLEDVVAEARTSFPGSAHTDDLAGDEGFDAQHLG